jgi:PAS domain S-box-containing protein
MKTRRSDEAIDIVDQNDVFVDKDQSQVSQTSRSYINQYSQIFENLDDEIHVWRLILDKNEKIITWKLVDANASALQSWNKSKREVIGKTTDEIFGEGSTDLFMPIVQKIFSTGKLHRWKKHFEKTGQYLSMTSIPMGDTFISAGKDISEEKKAERSLRENKELLQQAEKLSSQGTWKFTFESGELAVSDGWLQIHGVSNPEITKTEVMELAHPHDLEMLKSLINNAIDNNEKYEVEHRIIRQDTGEIRWIKAIGETSFNEDGKPESLIGISRDITEEKIAKSTLQESKDLLQKAESISNQGSWKWDLRKDEWTLSENWLNIHGFTKPKITKDDLTQIAFPADLPSIQEAWKKVFDENCPYNIEHRIIKQDTGEVRWVKAIGELSYNENGDPVLLTGIAKDITDEKQAERKLKENAELLTTAEKMANQGSWKWDIKNDQWTFSDNWYKLQIGFQKKGLQKEDLLRLSYPDDVPMILESLEAALSGKRPYNIEHRFIKEDTGEVRWVKVRGRVIFSEDGSPETMIGIGQDITYEKQAELALKQSEEFLNRMGEIAHVGGWRLVDDFQNVKWTNSTCRIHEMPHGFNPTLEEAIQFYHPDFRKKILRAVKKAINKGVPFEVEAKIITAAGNELWVNSIGKPEMKDGKCVHLLGTIQNITERKKTASKLNLLTTALEHSLNGFDIVNHEGKFIYANRAHSKMFGYDGPEEIIGSSPVQLCVDPKFPENLIKELRKNGEYICELKAKRKDGSEFDLLMYSRLDYDENGHEIYPTASVDITQRLKYERELTESEKRFRTVFQNSAVAKVMADDEGNYIDANESACELLGYSKEELIGLSIKDVVIGQEESPRETYRKFKKKGFQTGVVKLLKKNGEVRYAEYYAKCIDDNLNLSTLVDITRKREIEEKRIAAQRKLNKSQKQLKELTNSVPGVIYQMRFNKDGSYSITYMSDNAPDLLGYELRKMKSPKFLFSRIHPDDLHMVLESIEKAGSANSRWSQEFRAINNKNEIIWIKGDSKGYLQKDSRVVHSGIFVDITLHKEAEKQLKISEKREAHLAENLPGIVLIYKLNNDGSNELLFISKMVSELYELSQEEVLKNNELLWKRVHPEDVMAFRKSIKDSADNLKPWKFEHRLLFPDGRVKWIDMRGIPNKTDDGSVIWDSIGIDVTDKKRSEKALEVLNNTLERKVEERTAKILNISKELQLYRLAAEHAVVGLWRFNIANKELLWDDTMYELFGVDKTDFSGAYDAWEASLHPDDRDKAVYEMGLALEGKKPFDTLFRIIDLSTGRTKHIRAKGKVERDHDGNPIFMYGTNWDVSREMELTKMNALAYQELEIYKMAAENSESGVWHTFLASNNSKWDDTLYNMYELDRKQYPELVPVEVWMNMIHPEDYHDTVQKIEEALATKSFIDVRFRIITAKTKKIKYIRSKGSIRLDEEGNPIGAFGTNWDFTKEMELADEREKALNHLKETQGQLIESEKMASLGILTAGVAHEINNPLNFIVGGHSAIEEYFEQNQMHQDEELKEYLSWIKKGADRATKIIRSLNRFSRNTEDMLEFFDINTVLNDCLLVLRNKQDEKINIIKTYEKGKVGMRGNSGMLHQAFLNLLSNSIDSINGEGKIEISTKSKKNRVQITISDTGCGIKEEDLNKITDPFFTTKAPGKGTGLGLSITKSIIENHQGEMLIESQLNKGTTIRIELPKR